MTDCLHAFSPNPDAIALGLVLLLWLILSPQYCYLLLLLDFCLLDIGAEGAPALSF